MSDIELLLRKIVAEEVDQAIRARLPEYIRAIGIKDVDEDDPELVGAEEVASLLGYDVSTPKNIRKSTKRVYTLASRNLIPSVRVSPRCVRFNLAKVKEVLDRGGLAEPYSRSA